MNTADEELRAKTLRESRLIVGSLVMGVFMLAIAAVVVPKVTEIRDRDLEFVTWMGLGLIPVSMVASAVMVPLAEASGRRYAAQTQRAKAWYEIFQQRTIVGCALMEAAAFLCLIGAMMTGNIWGFVGGLGCAALMILLYFPTDERVRIFVARQREMAQSHGA